VYFFDGEGELVSLLAEPQRKSRSVGARRAPDELPAARTSQAHVHDRELGGALPLVRQLEKSGKRNRFPRS
jgi:hypothetical protein